MVRAHLWACDPDQVYKLDRCARRYGYGNQPHAAHWNLLRGWQAFSPLLKAEAEISQSALEAACSPDGGVGPRLKRRVLLDYARSWGLAAGDGDGVNGELTGAWRPIARLR